MDSALKRIKVVQQTTADVMFCDGGFVMVYDAEFAILCDDEFAMLRDDEFVMPNLQ